MQRKVKIMPKRKKTKASNVSESNRGRFTYCSACGSRQMIKGKCKKCGSVKTPLEKTTASKKADQDSEREEPKSTDS